MQAQAQQASAFLVYRTLVGIGVLCATLIVSAYIMTGPAIERNKADALKQAIFDVIPGASEFVTLKYDSGFGTADETSAEASSVYVGFHEKQIVGIAMTTQAFGYQDVIKIIYGYSPELQAIVGIKVLESRETPGLGDKIETDPQFLANFEALSVTLKSDKKALEFPIVAVKSGQKKSPGEIDGITGATISSVAIAQMLNDSANIWVPRLQSSQFVVKATEARNER